MLLDLPDEIERSNVVQGPGSRKLNVDSILFDFCWTPSSIYLNSIGAYRVLFVYVNVFRKDMHVPAYANHFIYYASGDFPQGIKRDFNVRSNAISTSAPET